MDLLGKQFLQGLLLGLMDVASFSNHEALPDAEPVSNQCEECLCSFLVNFRSMHITFPVYVTRVARGSSPAISCAGDPRSMCLGVPVDAYADLSIASS